MSNETEKRDVTLSRRQFFRACAPALAGLAIASTSVQRTHASSGGQSGEVPAILIDTSRCVGCGNCQRACAEANDLPQNADPQAGLSAEVYTYVDAYEVAGGKKHYVKRACMHCLEPGCAAACPVAALHKTPEGPVVADTSKCIGCRYCQYACPFGVPRFEWDNTLGVMRKCTSCTERLEAGQQPACVTGCPSGALRFGTRTAMLAEAHARIKANPGRYVDTVYGETEAGGTARLYLSDVPFEEIGLPVLDELPVPRYAEQVMTKTPVIAGGVALFSTVAYTLLKRRERGLHTESNEHEEAR